MTDKNIIFCDVSSYHRVTSNASNHVDQYFIANSIFWLRLFGKWLKILIFNNYFSIILLNLKISWADTATIMFIFIAKMWKKSQEVSYDRLYLMTNTYVQIQINFDSKVNNNGIFKIFHVSGNVRKLCNAKGTLLSQKGRPRSSIILVSQRHLPPLALHNLWTSPQLG